MASVLTAPVIDRLFQKCLASLPKSLSTDRYRIYERTTRIAVDAMARRMNRKAGMDFLAVEEEIRSGAGITNLPPWLVRSRVVLSLRDCLRDPDFRTAFTALGRKARGQALAQWAAMGADLYRNWPDRKVMSKAPTALRILSGDDPLLRPELARAIAQDDPRVAKDVLDTGLVARVSSAFRSLTQVRIPRVPSITEPVGEGSGARLQDPDIDDPRDAAPPRRSAPAPALRPRPSARNEARPSPRQAAATGNAHPTSSQRGQASTGSGSASGSSSGRGLVVSGSKRREGKLPANRLSFEQRIAQRFSERGLAPVALRAATIAAKVMAAMVRRQEIPTFFDVEYEVLLRSGESIAPGAVRTWTLHAYMECMRDPWFRDLFNAMPSEQRAETVAEWAKAAADWFDVPGKLADFWIRALSGGDPVLAAAAAPAFRARSHALPGPGIGDGTAPALGAPMGAGGHGADVPGHQHPQASAAGRGPQGRTQARGRTADGYGANGADHGNGHDPEPQDRAQGGMNGAQSPRPRSNGSGHGIDMVQRGAAARPRRPRPHRPRPLTALPPSDPQPPEGDGA